jgi:hypothetical protein
VKDIKDTSYSEAAKLRKLGVWFNLRESGSKFHPHFPELVNAPPPKLPRIHKPEDRIFYFNALDKWFEECQTNFEKSNSNTTGLPNTCSDNYALPYETEHIQQSDSAAIEVTVDIEPTYQNVPADNDYVEIDDSIFTLPESDSLDGLNTENQTDPSNHLLTFTERMYFRDTYDGGDPSDDDSSDTPTQSCYSDPISEKFPDMGDEQKLPPQLPQTFEEHWEEFLKNVQPDWQPYHVEMIQANYEDWYLNGLVADNVQTDMFKMTQKELKPYFAFLGKIPTSPDDPRLKNPHLSYKKWYKSYYKPKYQSLKKYRQAHLDMGTPSPDSSDSESSSD